MTGARLFTIKQVLDPKVQFPCSEDKGPYPKESAAHTPRDPEVHDVQQQQQHRVRRVFSGTVLALGALVAAPVFVPTPAHAASPTYEISVGSGQMLSGTADSGIHCEYSACGTYLSPQFPVKVYGNTYSQAYVSSSGAIQFGGANNTQANEDMPSGAFSGPTFLPLWDQLYSGTGGNGYGIYTRTVGVAPNRQWVLEWRTISSNDGNYYNFSHAFGENGTVKTTYASASGGGGSATVGVQNGSTFSQYSANQVDALYNGLQITYSPTVVLDPPSAPRDPEATVLNTNQSALFWDTPATDGGSTITGYQVHRNGRSTTGEGEYTSPVLPADRRSFNFGRLVPGATYTFDVVAINSQGRSQPAYATVTQPAGPPSAPVIGTAAPGAVGGQVQAKARWSAPASSGGTAITGYRVFAYKSTGTVSQSVVLARSAREFTMRLPSKGQWRFRVVAINAAGQSPLSGYSNYVTAR